AEDGIRDLTVTGVQTCALPIYRLESECRSQNHRWRIFVARETRAALCLDARHLGGDGIGSQTQTRGLSLLRAPARAETPGQAWRSEERRVGKECRCGGAKKHEK